MLLQDLKYAMRQLAGSPGFALTAVISLGLGIGATTAVFSVIYAALIHPFPYREASRILALELDSKNDETPFRPNGPEMRLLRQSPVIEGLIAIDGRSLSLTGGDYPEDVDASFVTPNTFEFLGVPPLLGRGLIPSDAIDGEEPQPIVVLSYEFWRHHFGGNPEVVGRNLELDHKIYRIVGVASRQFRWDNDQVYIPFQPTQDSNVRYISYLRLRPGVSRKAAASVLQSLIEQFARDNPQRYPTHFRLEFYGLNDWVQERMGKTLGLLLASVGLLLAIGCGNVSILLLARGTVRGHELAVRSAVGAGRWRIFRQLLTESLLLAAIGAGLGLLLAFGAVAAIRSVQPGDIFPSEFSPDINLPVLSFCTGVSLLTTFLFGLWPAFRHSHAAPGKLLQSGTSGIAGTFRGRWTHRLLITAQIALTLLLLAGASAAIHSFLRLLHVGLGYDPHNVIEIWLPIREASHANWSAEVAYFEALRAAVTRVPGVSAAAFATHAVPPYAGWYLPFELTSQACQRHRSAFVDLVSPDFFSTLRIPLLRGRVWDELENHNAAPVAVINQAMARLCFPKGSAVGASLRLSDTEGLPSDVVTAPGIASSNLQVIGVVGDSLNHGLRSPAWPAIFVPWTFWMQPGAEILVRSRMPLEILTPNIRRALAKVNPEQQAGRRTANIEQWIKEDPEWQREQLVASLFTVFAGLALSLAAVGVYSVISYAVAHRTNEFGIRIALGANRAHLLRIVLESASLGVGSGLIVGVTLAQALGKFNAKVVGSNLNGSVPLMIATALLAAVATAACLLPARRALTTDPVTALRRD